MEIEEDIPRQMRSVKQIADEMVSAKQEFDKLINCLQIPSLSIEEDLEKRNSTIETLLRDLPSEQRLKEMLDNPAAGNTNYRHRVLTNYRGNYEFIRKAAENIKNLKPQAEKLYFLAAQLNLEKLQNVKDSAIKESKLRNAQIYQNENTRLPRYERNMLAPGYLRQLKTEELKTTHGKSGDLSPGEPLLHINLYDSLAGEKTFEYVAYSQQTLLDVISKFYCLIAKLQHCEQSQFNNCYCLIENCFYFNGPQARKHIAEIIRFADEKKNHSEGSTPHPLEMSRTKLKNLRFVFGRPYIFRHLEGCDHTIIFKDLRLLSEGPASVDLLQKEKYPVAVFEGRMRRRKCQGCRTRFSSLVSLNDPLKNGRHLYLCTECHGNLYPEPSNSAQLFVPYIHD